jgi:hypothetical protein
MMNLPATPTVESIVSILNSNPAAVGCAMVALLSRQTAGEQHAGVTVESNGRGFSAFTASSGTYFAKYVLGLSSYSSEYETSRAIVAFLAGNGGGRLLTNNGGKRNFLDKARKIAITHRAQLLEVALAKHAQIVAAYFDVADVG